MNVGSGRLDGRGYRISDASSIDSCFGSGEMEGKSADIADDDEKASESGARDRTDSCLGDTYDCDDNFELLQLRKRAESAELQKKTTDILLRSEQQRSISLSMKLEELQKQNVSEKEAATEAKFKLSQQIKEREQVQMELSDANDQLIQRELQLNEQKRELERLSERVSRQETQILQVGTENNELTTELDRMRLTAQNLHEEKVDLASKGEQLSIDYARRNIEFLVLEKKLKSLQMNAAELSDINTALQNSTNTLQQAFEGNLQELESLRLENSKLKSEIQSAVIEQFDHLGRKDQMMAKLQQRRELLELITASRVAAAARAEVFNNLGLSVEASASKIQAHWENFVDQNDSIVTVLRKGQWTQAILLDNDDSDLNRVEYFDGSKETVSSTKVIQRQRKRRPVYFESPPTARKKRRK